MSWVWKSLAELPRGRASHKNLAPLLEDAWEARPRGDFLQPHIFCLSTWNNRRLPRYRTPLTTTF